MLLFIFTWIPMIIPVFIVKFNSRPHSFRVIYSPAEKYLTATLAPALINAIMIVMTKRMIQSNTLGPEQQQWV